MSGPPGHEGFAAFAAIDWSGAKGSRHRGIAVALCRAGAGAPVPVEAPGGIWSRAAVRDWLLAQAEVEPTLFGFDFSFAPPLIGRGSYLPGEAVPENARAFWAYVDLVCADEDLGAASFLELIHRRHFYFGAADGVKADFMHNRLCESHYNAGGGGKPSTVYDAIGAAQVAKASFAGMRMLHALGQAVPIWPFDPLPASGALVVEIYTGIAARAAGRPKGRTKIRDAETLALALAALGSEPHRPLARYADHLTDAMVTAAWMRRAAALPTLWQPPLLEPHVARTEGWTFGVI
jgi:hypothetical protein